MITKPTKKDQVMLEMYQGTGCQVFIAGYLHKVPKIYMDKDGTLNSVLQISRRKAESINQHESTADYQAILLGENALRIRQFGFPGLHLFIQGDLQSDGKIIVEEINFLNSPASNIPNNNIHARKKQSLHEHKTMH